MPHKDALSGSALENSIKEMNSHPNTPKQTRLNVTLGPALGFFKNIHNPQININMEAISGGSEYTVARSLAKINKERGMNINPRRMTYAKLRLNTNEISIK